MADTNDRNSIIERHKKAVDLEVKKNIETVVKAINDKIAELRAKIAKLDICIENYEESEEKSESGKMPSTAKPTKSLECMYIKNINGVIGEEKFEIDLNNKEYIYKILLLYKSGNFKKVVRKMNFEKLKSYEDFKKVVRKMNFEKLKSYIDEIINTIQTIDPKVQTFDHVINLTEEFMKNCKKYNWHNPETKKTIFEKEQYDEFMKMIKLLISEFTPEIKQIPRKELLNYPPVVIEAKLYPTLDMYSDYSYIKLTNNKIFTDKILIDLPYLQYESHDKKIIFSIAYTYSKFKKSSQRFIDLIFKIYSQTCKSGNYPTRCNLEPSNLIYENPNYTFSCQPKKCSGECQKNNVRDLLDTEKDTDSTEVHESALQVKEELRAKIKKLEEKLDELLLNEADRFIGK